MAATIIQTPKAPAAIGPYSQAIMANGFLFTSGQLGIDPESGTLPSDIAGQAKQSLQNLGAILEEAGYQKSDVIKTVIFLKNMADFGTVNEIYAAFFGEHKPARSCIEVAALPKNGLIEIEAVAQHS